MRPSGPCSTTSQRTKRKRPTSYSRPFAEERSRATWHVTAGPGRQIIDTMNVQEWAEHHHHQGHHPHPAPTAENPTRWNCECGGVWRILTPEQIEKKFAHLKPDMT